MHSWKQTENAINATCERRAIYLPLKATQNRNVLEHKSDRAISPGIALFVGKRRNEFLDPIEKEHCKTIVEGGFVEYSVKKFSIFASIILDTQGRLVVSKSIEHYI